MRQVAPFALWTGNAGDGANVRQIHDAGIRAVVDLAVNETMPSLTRELIYCRFPLLDGAGNDAEMLKLAIRTSAQLIGAGTATLVFCSAGMSRSPAIATAALTIATGKSIEECLSTVFGDGPRDLSPILWANVVNVVAAIQRKQEIVQP